MRIRTCVKPACMGKFFLNNERFVSFYLFVLFVFRFLFCFHTSGARVYVYEKKNKLQNASDDTYGFPFLIHGDGLRYSYARWILVLTINPL